MPETLPTKEKLKRDALKASKLITELADDLTSEDELKYEMARNRIVTEINALGRELRLALPDNEFDEFIFSRLRPQFARLVAELIDAITRNIRRIVAGFIVVCLLLAAIFFAREQMLKGHGLVGLYYRDTDFDALVDRRIDRKIDFIWRLRSPLGDMSNRNFSIHWEGFVKTEQPGTHYFYTLSDDGVRLWVDDQLIIKNWTVHGPTTDYGAIELAPGFHKIELEYFQGVGGNRIRLTWQQPSDSKAKPISPKRLFPQLPDNVRPVDPNVKLGVSMGAPIRAVEKDTRIREEREKRLLEEKIKRAIEAESEAQPK
jgi:hypothetical protein